MDLFTPLFGRLCDRAKLAGFCRTRDEAGPQCRLLDWMGHGYRVVERSTRWLSTLDLVNELEQSIDAVLAAANAAAFRIEPSARNRLMDCRNKLTKDLEVYVRRRDGDTPDKLGDRRTPHPEIATLAKKLADAEGAVERVTGGLVLERPGVAADLLTLSELNSTVNQVRWSLEESLQQALSGTNTARSEAVRSAEGDGRDIAGGIEGTTRFLRPGLDSICRNGDHQ